MFSHLYITVNSASTEQSVSYMVRMASPFHIFSTCCRMTIKVNHTAILFQFCRTHANCDHWSITAHAFMTTKPAWLQVAEVCLLSSCLIEDKQKWYRMAIASSHICANGLRTSLLSPWRRHILQVCHSKTPHLGNGILVKTLQIHAPTFCNIFPTKKFECHPLSWSANEHT
jgi:hypothetical protein